MMRSPCCNAEVKNCGPTHATNWYACTACGQPCDPVDYERAGNSCGKTNMVHRMLFPHLPPLEASEKDATLSHPDGCSEGEK